MTATHRIENAKGVSQRSPTTAKALEVLLGLLVIGAVQGGLAMVTNPVSPLGMSLDFLAEAPVDDYFWPGVFLLGIAAASLVTIVGLLVGWEWRWATRIENRIGFKWPWIGALAIGIVLLVFEIAELFLIPFHPIMHPLLIAASLAIVLLAIAPTTRRHLSARAD